MKVNWDKKNVPNDKCLKVLIYCFVFVLLLIKHRPLKLVSDDVYHIKYELQTFSILDFIILQYNSNGRFLTDGLAYVFYHLPFTVWKIVNPLIICFSARIIAEEFTKDKLTDNIYSCLLVMTFPIEYMKSAGYIASSTNYIYTMVATLIAIFPIVITRKKHINYSVLVYLPVIPAILYLCNHDQYGLIMLMGLTVYLVYIFLNSKKIIKISTFEKKEIKLVLFAYFLIILVYALMFFTPGHLFRMNNDAEWQYWFPQYGDWDLGDKILHGYTSTVSNLFFRDSKPVIAFITILAIISILKYYFTKEKTVGCVAKMFIGISPLLLQISIKLFGYKRFVAKHKYTYGMFDVDNLKEKRFIAAFVVSIIMLVLIISAIVVLINNIERRLMIFLLLAMGAASHEMLGFSGTIYASNLRTFTLLLYIIIICTIMLLNEIHDLSDDNNVNENLIDICLSFVLCSIALWI